MMRSLFTFVSVGSLRGNRPPCLLMVETRRHPGRQGRLPPRFWGSMAAILAMPIALVAAPPVLDYTVQLDVIQEGYDGVHCWVHPRAGIVPQPGGQPPAVVLTMQQLWLKGSDVFGPLNDLRTDDLGRTWSKRTEHAAMLGQRDEGNGVTVGACD